MFLATLSLLLGCLFGLWGGGCSPAPLARPAILGASASAGFGCEIDDPSPGGKAYLADMEAVYQAIVPGWHSDPVFLADASFYTRSRQSVVEQMDAALARNPSVIIAIDYLFWPTYAARDTAMTPDAVERDRHDALEQALAQLDRFSGPVIIGDLPDMRSAVGHMLSERNIPPAGQLEAFNRRIAAWAHERRQRTPVVVLPVSAMARAVESGQPLPTSFETFTGETAATLLQPDRLHPTTTGLVVMLREGLAGLAAQRVISPGDFRTDLADITARLHTEAAAVDSRREPGLWTLLSVKGKLDDFSEAIEAKDCTRASELFDQVMEKATRLKKSPHDFAGVYIGFTLASYRYYCKDAPEVVRRWRDRLAPAIERPLPDAWPLDLWHEFNTFLDEEQRTVDRTLQLKRANAALPSDYDDTIRSAAWFACYSDPAVFLELLPGWQSELERNIRSAEQTTAFWKEFSQGPKWPKEVEHRFKNALLSASSDEERQRITDRREEFNDPYPVIVAARAMAVDRIAILERALRLTGHAEEAVVVHNRLAQAIPADEAVLAYQRVEKSAAEAEARRKP